MKNICLNIEKALGTVSKEQVFAREAESNACMATLHNGTGAGNDFLGWLHLPSSITDAELADIEQTAETLRSKCEVVVAIGIGGSYLGARAVIEAMSNSFDWLTTDRKNPVMLYAGHNIGEDYLYELCEILKGKQFGIINISKSGTTTEPAIAFRMLKKQLEEAVGKEEAKHRIVAITDARKGALRTLATQEGYKTFVIPDNVGGRFSVLTPVGLLPIAVAGVNIRELVAGAVSMEKATDESVPFAENPAAIYAATRNELYKAGKKIEILCNFNPKLHYIAEWWKQLYGESEGKEGNLPGSGGFDNRFAFDGAMDPRRRAHDLRNGHLGRSDGTQHDRPDRCGKSRRTELPGRKTCGRSEQDGRAGHAVGARRRRRSEPQDLAPGHHALLHRPALLLLREGLRHQRLYARRESI